MKIVKSCSDFVKTVIEKKVFEKELIGRTY